MKRPLSILIILIGSFLAACQSGNIKKRNMEELYISGGTEKYYLADVPAWSNFSSIGQCRRIEPIRYLNFDNLHKSYSMSYEELIQFQFMMNRKIRAYRQSSGKDQLFLKDESFIFYNTYEQIIGGGRDFQIPKYERVHLIWIDSVLSDNKRLKKLIELMNSSKMQQGYPVLVSTCLSSFELEEFIAKNKLTQLGVKGVSQEMFAPFDDQMNLTTDYRIYFDKLFSGKYIVLYAPWFPKEFIGVEKLEKY